MKNLKPLIVGILLGGLLMLGVASVVAIIAIPRIVGNVARGGVRSPGGFTFQINGKPAGHVSAEADESKKFTVSGPAKLNVDDFSGNITVTGGGGNEVVVAAHKIAWGDTQADAKAELVKMKAVVTQRDNSVTARVEFPKVEGVAQLRGSVHFTVTVPTETSVIAHTDYGVVVQTGTTGNSDLKSSSGKIKVKDVKGDLLAHSDYGSITAEEVVATSVKAHSSSGPVSATNVRVKGTVTLTSDYGAIEFSSGEAEALEAKTGSGNVSLSNLKVQGAVIAKSDYGKIALKQVSASSYDAHSSSGAVSIAGAHGKVKAQSDYGHVEVTDARDAELDLKTSSGAVVFTGSLKGKQHKLHSDYGHVTMRIPKDAALTVDLTTDYGKVKSDFPIVVKGEQEKTRLQGPINGGGASLSASTSSGNVSLQMLAK